VGSLREDARRRQVLLRFGLRDFGAEVSCIETLKWKSTEKKNR
jgi:hypothetical protein